MARVREGNRAALLVIDVQVGVMADAMEAPRVIGNVALGQINGNSSSIHDGLLLLKTDPHPHEHRLRQLGAEKEGESIPSFKSNPLRGSA